MKNMIAMTEPRAELLVDVQTALDDDNDEPPSASEIVSWAQAAYSKVADSAGEVTVRLVGESEMAQLNSTYRDKDKTTNVLSFPFDSDIPLPDDIDVPLLGDVVICHKVVAKEAREQQKKVLHHYAHMVTHGVLHLCGYDHIEDSEAEEMEALEIQILASSNIANPYN